MAEDVFRSREFQKILKAERLKYYKELADDPERSKKTAIGMLLLSLDNLMLQGDYEKVVEGVLKLARVEGWIGADTNVSVFHGLTAKEFDEIRRKLTEKAASVQSN